MAMATQTAISLCAQALVRLGAQPIQSFEENTDRARICSVAYPGLRDAIIAGYPWRCMMTKKELTRSATVPAGQFAYQFLIPGEALTAPSATFSNQDRKLADHEFKQFGRHLMADFPRVWADYVTVKPESEWPAWFFDLVMSCLCAEIAFAITDQQSTADTWRAVAYGTPGDDGIGGKLAQARLVDSQGSGNVGIYSETFIDARMGV